MKNGTNVWYVLTDVDDSDEAAELGLNFSAKMTFMASAARTSIWAVTTPSPARLSASSSPPMGLRTAQIHNGKACPQIWRMVFDPTMS